MLISYPDLLILQARTSGKICFLCARNVTHGTTVHAHRCQVKDLLTNFTKMDF